MTSSFCTALDSLGFALGFAGIALGVVAWGCQGEYKLEPTFCDDWCRATLAPGCNLEPADCVTDCELTKASSACADKQASLLSCYERAEPGTLKCTQVEFRSGTRVVGGACQEQRDTLFECEAPGIGACLDSCRLAQQEQFGDIVGPSTMLNRPSPTDAGAPLCPSLVQPCEDLCWLVMQYAGVGAAFPGTVSSVDAAAWQDPLLQSLLGCYPSSNTDSGADGQAPR